MQLLFQRLSGLEQPLMPGAAEVGSVSSSRCRNKRFVHGSKCREQLRGRLARCKLRCTRPACLLWPPMCCWVAGQLANVISYHPMNAKICPQMFARACSLLPGSPYLHQSDLVRALVAARGSRVARTLPLLLLWLVGWVVSSAFDVEWWPLFAYEEKWGGGSGRAWILRGEFTKESLKFRAQPCALK